MIRTMKQSTGTVPRTTMRIHAADLGSLARSFVALASLTIATLAAAASWDDDSHYVSLGSRSGYYIVRPDSRLSHQLGVEAAPTIDTADPFRHGSGCARLPLQSRWCLIHAASLHRPSGPQ
jgi:hypothetical protein